MVVAGASAGVRAASGGAEWGLTAVDHHPAGGPTGDPGGDSADVDEAVEEGGMIAATTRPPTSEQTLDQ